MTVKITGSGSFIPNKNITNIDFIDHIFLDQKGNPLQHSNEVIVNKFKTITGIEERKYASDDLQCSDLAYFASQKAIENAAINPETIDYIIFAHNFGDIKKGTIQTDMLPSLATRVKHKLQIKNPKCVAYDIIFGCPGWIEGVLQANAFIKSGMAKRCLVIGAETLSRIVDPHDRDSMIYADGAGATIIEASQNDNEGIIAHESATFAMDEANFLFFGGSYDKSKDQNTKYIKMHGHKIYEFALTEVPQAMKNCLDKSGVKINEVKKILIHQANEKMDEAIVNRFYKLYDMPVPPNVMPMIINTCGNSSVATIPTLFDLVTRGELQEHEINTNDIILFASVGAGMNVNAIVYRVS